MVVENHVKFAEWSIAFDKLTQAHNNYYAAVVAKVAASTQSSLKGYYLLALSEYNRVSKEVDA